MCCDDSQLRADVLELPVCEHLCGNCIMYDVHIKLLCLKQKFHNFY